MIHNQVVVFIQCWQSGFRIYQIFLVTGIILAGLLHSGKKDRIIFLLWAQLIVPFLDKQN